MPNPDQSAGSTLRKKGRVSCWEAEGEVRRVFIQTYEGIRIHLGDYEKPVQHLVDLLVYMVGHRKETSKPTIFFYCEKPDCQVGCRKNVKETVEEGKVMKKYPGFWFSHCSQPPDFKKPFKKLVSKSKSENEIMDAAEEQGNGDLYFELEGYRNLSLAPVQDEHEIRLLVLKPGEHLDVLVSRIVHALNSEDLEYTAYSFSGPNASQKEKIMVDGKEYEAPCTLCTLINFLKSIRSPAEERSVWMEVLCMDPGNEEEL